MSTTRLVDKILVRGNSPASTTGVLSIAGNDIPCALGRSGIAWIKREGDGITPAGQWPLRRILYRADRIGQLDCHLPAIPLARHHGWCDAPDDPAYNSQVGLPYPASAEQLWRDDPLYDVIIVLGHNDDPVIPGKGSAVFFHIARDGYLPTEGCVAITLADMKGVLQQCGPDTLMKIVE